MIYWLFILLAGMIAVPLVIERTRRPMDDAARGAAPGQFVELSQGVTHYDWLGPQRGPVAICVHGLSTPSFVYRGMAKGLALLGFRVLLYDLYGRGFSSRPKGQQNSAFFVRQLEDLLSHLRIADDVTLIGYSMGGAISTSYAAANPDRVRRLILLAPAGMGINLAPRVKFAVKKPIIGDWLMLALYPFSLRKTLNGEKTLPSSVPGITDMQEAELDFRGFVPAILASLRGILATPQQAEHMKLHQMNLPVLAIWGEDDAVIPASSIGTLGAWNRNARQEVIEDAGHALTYSHTEETLAIITHWLREEQTSGAEEDDDLF
ncbi:MAG: alpha/beta fold hydrolase [Sulfitobacter sp.]